MITAKRLEELLNSCIAHIMELESPSDYEGTFHECLGFTKEEMKYFDIEAEEEDENDD